MEPTIRRGDLMLIDGSRRSAEEDAVYALEWSCGIIPRRLQVDWAGEVWVRHDNRHYPDQHAADLPPGSLRIVGRVVWVGRWL